MASLFVALVSILVGLLVGLLVILLVALLVGLEGLFNRFPNGLLLWLMFWHCLSDFFLA